MIPTIVPKKLMIGTKKITLKTIHKTFTMPASFACSEDFCDFLKDLMNPTTIQYSAKQIRIIAKTVGKNFGPGNLSPLMIKFGKDELNTRTTIDSVSRTSPKIRSFILFTSKKW